MCTSTKRGLQNRIRPLPPTPRRQTNGRGFHAKPLSLVTRVCCHVQRPIKRPTLEGFWSVRRLPARAANRLGKRLAIPALPAVGIRSALPKISPASSPELRRLPSPTCQCVIVCFSFLHRYLSVYSRHPLMLRFLPVRFAFFVSLPVSFVAPPSCRAEDYKQACGRQSRA
jgi:hypothetical protein